MTEAQDEAKPKTTSTSQQVAGAMFDSSQSMNFIFSSVGPGAQFKRP